MSFSKNKTITFNSIIKMEIDHQRDLVPLLEKLYDISYVSAKELLHEIADLPMESNLKLFWKLACILYDDEQDQIQNNFNKWVCEAVHDTIPFDCHPFLRALFLNDTEGKIKEAKKIHPEFQLVFYSSKKNIKDAKKVPPFLQNKSFKYGRESIPGSSVWALIMGDTTQILSLKLPWVFLFTLHFWNSGNEISSFYDTMKSENKNHEQDPIYLLMKYYSKIYPPNDGDILLADIASLLPPLDMFFFLKIFQAIDNNVSENSISLALNIVQYQLIQMDYLDESIDLLSNNTKDSGQDKFIFQLAQYISSPEPKLTKTEKHMIEKCSDVIDKRYMYLYKANKAQILQEFNSSKSLEYAGRATDFFLESAGITRFKQETNSSTSTTNSSNSNDSNDSDSNEFDSENEEIDPFNFQYANYQAYDVYLVKAMIKGEGLDKLYEWSGIFEKHQDAADMSDGTQTYQMAFEAIKLSDKNEIVDQSLLERIADAIKKNTKLYIRFRYYVASKLYKQPNGFALFSEFELIKKDKLLEIYEEAFQ